MSNKKEQKWWEKRYDPGSSMYRHYKALHELGLSTDKKKTSKRSTRPLTDSENARDWVNRV